LKGIHFASPPPVISPHVDANYDGKLLRFRAVDDFVVDASVPGQVAHVLEDLELHLGSTEEPPNFAAAKQEECWRTAMLEEMAAIKENET
jgi:hypothetical protein